MEALTDFMNGIATAVSSAFEWFSGFLEDSVYFLELLGDAVASIPDYFSWLPANVLAMLVVLAGVILVCRILGREG